MIKSLLLRPEAERKLKFKVKNVKLWSQPTAEILYYLAGVN